MKESDFLSMMEDIDKELRRRDVPIDARPIHAIGEASKRLQIEIIGGPNLPPAVAGRYDTLTLAAHISDWYQARYGDRLKIHLGPGSVALLIRGDPWRLVLPRIFGTVTVTCDPDLEKYKNEPILNIGKRRQIPNILNCINDLPSGFAATLTDVECKEILDFFTSCLSCLQEMETIAGKPYLKEALADLDAAVSHIFTRPPQYGHSKWSSLQFVEKLLKSFLEQKGAKIPRHHKLTKIAQDAQAVGLEPLNPHLISIVQCSAGVRYGEISVTLEEAIKAHHASLDLAKRLTAQIKKA